MRDLKNKNSAGIFGFVFATVLVVVLISSIGHGQSLSQGETKTETTDVANIHSTIKPGLDLDTYAAAVDSVSTNRSDELMCWLNASSKRDSDEHGSWRKVSVKKNCPILDTDTLYISSNPHGLTRGEIVQAQKWFVGYLINHYFDSAGLDSSAGWDSWVERDVDSLYNPQMQSLLHSKVPSTAEADGVLVQSDYASLNFKAGSFLGVICHDGKQRLLAVSQQGRILEASFIGLKANQVTFSGFFSAYYRVDSRRLINYELTRGANWTRKSLKASHPNLFDGSPLAIRVDAGFEQTLEEVAAGEWRISSWTVPDVSYRWVY